MLNHQNTVVLVVDIQERLLPVLHQCRRMPPLDSGQPIPVATHHPHGAIPQRLGQNRCRCGRAAE